VRNTTTATRWRGGPDAFTVDKGAGVMIIAPAFHRDPDLLPSPDSFTPDIWLDGRAQQYPQLVPFSAGPIEGPQSQRGVAHHEHAVGSHLRRSRA